LVIRFSPQLKLRRRELRTRFDHVTCAAVISVDIKTKYCGLSKEDIHENPATIIHHSGRIAAWCWRRFGARHEERRGARAHSGGTAECPGGKGGAGLEIRSTQSARNDRQAAEPESDKKQLKTQKIDKGAPAAPAAKGSSDADGNANVKSKSTSESGAGAASSPNKSADEGKRSTTGQGEAGAANLTSEQHTKITGIIRRHKVAPTQLDCLGTCGNAHSGQHSG
jgi:hypothetical protein